MVSWNGYCHILVTERQVEKSTGAEMVLENQKNQENKEICTGS